MKKAMLLTFLVLVPALAGGAGDLNPGIQAFDARRFEEARKFFEPRAGGDARAAYYLGRTYVALRRFETGAEWLEKAVSGAPNEADYHFWLGRAYGQAAMESNVLKQAALAKKTKTEFEKAVALDPGHLGAREDLVQYYLLAPGFMGGSLEKAREMAAEIRKRDLARGILAAVSVHLNQKETAAAERELKAGLASVPGNVRLRMTLTALYQEQKRWNEAFETLDAGLRIDPQSYDLLFQIGRTGAVSGQRLDRAEESLKRYLTHAPGPESAPIANAHYRLGMVYEKKGDKAKAREQYQQAVKRDPNLKEAKEALKKLG